MNFKLKSFIPLAVLIAAVTVFIYFPSLDNDFTNWDDSEILVKNIYTHNLSAKNIKTIFFINKNSNFVLSEYIPLTVLTLTIENHFWGLNPKVYHTTNLVLHILNSLLVFTFIYAISRNKWVAFWTAFFWSIHTLHVEPVCWITGRKDTLYALFYLLSLITYVFSLQNDNKKIRWFTFIFFIIALLSKPAAVSLPLILILCDYLYSRKLLIQFFLKKWYFFATSIIFALIAIKGQNATAPIPEINLSNFFQNCLVACRGLTFYICKGFLPVNLSAVYPRTLTLSFFDINYFFPVIIVIIFFCIIYFCNKKFIYISFGLIFFFITLLPVLQFLPVGIQIYAADRFFYIPSIGFLFAIIVAVSHLTNKNNHLNRIAVFIAIGLIILLAGATRSRTATWQNSGTLWNNVIKFFPNFAFAQNALGSYYTDINDIENAKKHLLIATSITSDLSFPYHNLGALALKENNVSQAIFYAEKELTLPNGEENAYFLLGECNAFLSNKFKSLDYYMKGLKANPDNIEARKRFAFICLMFNETNKTIHQLEYILSLEPNNIFAHGKLALLSDEMKDYSKAEKHYNYLTKIDTQHKFNWYKLGESQQKNGKTNEAIASYANLLKFSPYHADTWNNIAVILKEQNNIIKAKKYIEIANEIKPDSDRILYNYACIAALDGDIDTAFLKLRKSIKINPRLKKKAKTEKDFTNLKNNPEFRKIVGK